MRFASFRNLIAVLICACGVAGAQGINPGLDVAWPVNCGTSSTYTYNFLTNTCFDVGAMGGGITQLTGDVTTGAPGSGSKTATLATVGAAVTVGDATHVPQVTTDAKGRTTSLVPVPIVLTGDVQGPAGSNSLIVVNSLPGICGDATHVCQMTTDANGRVILQTNSAIRLALPNIQLNMPTAPILSNSCTSLQSQGMAFLQNTSTFTTAFSSDPSTANGWGMNGGLVFVAYPQTGLIYWKVCNQSNGTITPGAITLNVGANP